MRKYLKLSLLLGAIGLASIGFGQPTGIYVLDNNQGVYRDANIRNYSFVDGFVWRCSWSDFETAEDVYSFAGIDHIVNKLDSLNKKLTILFGAYSVEPAYIAAHLGVTTYQFTDPLTAKTTTRAVPYDGYLLQRYRLLLAAMANHPIYCRSTGTMVALKDHPVLSNIATNIPGLGAIRNVNGQNTSLQTALPNYTRSKFVDSLLVSMKLQTTYFPTKNVFIPSYKNTTDNINSPTLVDYLKSQLLANFNGVLNPKIGFWQENLAGFTDANTKAFTGLPTTTFATPLLSLGNSAYAMFQMLQGWTTPFLDPTKTANSTPFDAMCYAYKTYGASYFEVYVSDLDNAIYKTGFSNWTVSNCSTIASLSDHQTESKAHLVPNPASNYISIKGIEVISTANVSILNVYGHEIAKQKGGVSFDISAFSNGVYFVKLEQNNKTIVLEFVKK